MLGAIFLLFFILSKNTATLFKACNLIKNNILLWAFSTFFKLVSNRAKRLM